MGAHIKQRTSKIYQLIDLCQSIFLFFFEK